MPAATFFIEGKYYGTGSVGPEVNHGDIFPPLSFAFFCSHCGEVWARIAVEGAEWQTYRAPCSRHPFPWFMPAGSIILPWVEDLHIEFPIEVLKREILVYAKEMERENAGIKSYSTQSAAI